MNATVDREIKIIKSLISINYTKGIQIKPKYIVIHGISEAFKTPKQYRDYLAKNEDIKKSLHFLVGETEIIQLLEENWRALHVGDKPSKVITNSNSIGIGFVIRRGDNKQVAVRNIIELINILKEKYNIPLDNILRHYDVTGKECPKELLSESQWTIFKGFINEDLNGEEPPKVRGKIIDVLSKLKFRKEPNNFSEIIGSVEKGEELKIYEILDEWVKIKKNIDGQIVEGYLAKSYVEFTSKKREEIKFSIVEDIIIDKEEKQQTKVSIPLEQVPYKPVIPRVKPEDKAVSKEVQERKIVPRRNMTRIPINKNGRIINVETNLNVRRGPGQEHFVIAYLLNDQIVHVVESVGTEWYRVVFNSTIGKRIGFIEKDYVTMEDVF